MNQEENTKAADNSPKAQVAKYKVKDSVFTDLFGEPKYLLQLYQALHPEDTDVTEDSISNVTIKNILLDQCYNDLGFQVGEKLVVLVEAQSSWTVNIIIRCLMYLAQTYQEYIEDSGQNIYGGKKIELPRPELYVIFTGERKTKPDYLYLSKEFFEGTDSAVEVKVKMIYDGKEGDIINQYVAFTRIYNKQVKMLGRTREAVLETIRICKNQDILREYLTNREKEVIDIMMTLFNDEYILKTYVESQKKEAAQEAAQKAAQAATQAATKNTKADVARKLYKKGNSVEDIADTLSVTVEDVENWLSLIVM